MRKRDFAIWIVAVIVILFSVMLIFGSNEQLSFDTGEEGSIEDLRLSPPIIACKCPLDNPDRDCPGNIGPGGEESGAKHGFCSNYKCWKDVEVEIPEEHGGGTKTVRQIAYCNENVAAKKKCGRCNAWDLLKLDRDQVAAWESISCPEESLSCNQEECEVTDSNQRTYTGKCTIDND